jgi:hypothetical protein
MDKQLCSVKINSPLIKNLMKCITEFKVNWIDIKERLRNKFSILSSKDLCFVEGKHGEMLMKVQMVLGKSNEQMDKLIYDL